MYTLTLEKLCIFYLLICLCFNNSIVGFIVLFEQSCLFCSLCGLHVPALKNVALASLVCLSFPLVQSVHMVEIDYVGQVDHRPAGDWCMARS